MAFVQFTKCIPPLDAVDHALRCVCLRWAPAEDGKIEIDVNKLEGENIRTAAAE